MRDPNLTEQPDRICDAWRRAYRDRSPQQLAIDVTRLFDKNWILEREKDKINQSLLDAQKQLRRERIWRRVLVAALGASWFAAKLILPYAIKGAIGN